MRPRALRGARWALAPWLLVGLSCSGEAGDAPSPSAGRGGGTSGTSAGGATTTGATAGAASGAEAGGTGPHIGGAAGSAGSGVSGGAGAAAAGQPSGGASTGGTGGAVRGGAAGASGGAGGPAAMGGNASGGNASGGATGAVRTPGCGVPNTEPQGMFTPHTLDVSGTSREYFVYLPKNYDPARAYPVVFLFHGAGGSGKSNNIPIQSSSGADAIVVGGTAQVNASENRTQWQFNSATSPDVAFFDAMVTAVSGAYCVDRSRIFAAGFSSGAWMCNLLGCVRASVLRGYGVVAGGLGGGTKSCAPEGVAAWFLHDQDDMENVIAGNERARDRLLPLNGCTATTLPVEPAPCVRYQGCRAGLPIDWCQTSGKGHSSQGSLSGPGMWRFFSSL